jgi:hypothetical protein
MKTQPSPKLHGPDVPNYALLNAEIERGKPAKPSKRLVKKSKGPSQPDDKTP